MPSLSGYCSLQLNTFSFPSLILVMNIVLDSCRYHNIFLTTFSRIYTYTTYKYIFGFVAPIALLPARCHRNSPDLSMDL
ncbi:hypothetical protein F4810DRAFT_660849 [Camillea tinctor]|nr:hypothetical protein F4810DRAFT_660849 [Camillea tinctor]